ncbi:MAG: hypothetical protein ACYDDU_07850 [Dermatophilaceae bacterium]
MRCSIIAVWAAHLAAAPATMGLVGNISFAQSVPVRVPSQATVVDDAGGQRSASATEPGDDNGEPGDGDDNGEPGDGDDNGGHGGGIGGTGGKDDGSGHS